MLHKLYMYIQSRERQKERFQPEITEKFPFRFLLAEDLLTMKFPWIHSSRGIFRFYLAGSRQTGAAISLCQAAPLNGYVPVLIALARQ